MAKTIKIFDTTLRDGEQSPGCSMNLTEKIEVAKQLELLNVDIIEAGFAIASPMDFESVKTIAETVKNATVASLARATCKDIDAAYEAVKGAVNPRIHTFLATSPIHMQYKLKMSEDEVIARVKEMVSYAKKYCSDVEFSAEDASRSDKDFLARVMETAIAAGATTVNIPDTVGYSTPLEFASYITYLKEHVSNIDKADISVHCHNDLGMAVANSLAAVRAGATQVECTVNGIGERAGNTSLEEVAMAIKTRGDYYDAVTNINTRQIYRSSKLISAITGVSIPPNKAITGANAFAHESGIHQHGMLKNRSTYEIMTPESIGKPAEQMVLGKHSGRHAFEERLEILGYRLTKEELDRSFEHFKVLADKKKSITDRDIEALLANKKVQIHETYTLERFVINSGNTITSTAMIKVKSGDDFIEKVATGDGPIDAAFKTINQITERNFVLRDYVIHAVTEGEDALGEAVVKLNLDGKKATGRAISTDIVEASIKAYLNGVNKLIV
ncbi:MAG: 2-isopropylmalate synthase [Ruminococcaceae bacterium]|nr:2-isopropylmalate synthase [Oscillospiraceae bacterium]